MHTMPLPACRFKIEDLGPFDGFAHGTTWNGFDDVSVTVGTARAINAELRKTQDDEIPGEPDASGLVSLAGGYCAQVVDMTIRISPSPTGDEPALSTWTSFVETNADLRPPAEMEAICSDLLSGKVVVLNEGAAGKFTLMIFNPRFVLAVGAYQETHPDMPDDLPLCIYDRQERQVAVSVANAYSNLLCLEHTTTAAAQPFTNLEAWLNGLSNRGLVSEGVPATKYAARARPLDVLSIAAELLTKAGLSASFEFPGVIDVTMSNGFTYHFGAANGPFGYDLSTPTEQTVQDSGGEEIPASSSPAELVAFVQSVIAKGAHLSARE